jgi:hypothetical protein
MGTGESNEADNYHDFYELAFASSWFSLFAVLFLAVWFCFVRTHCMHAYIHTYILGVSWGASFLLMLAFPLPVLRGLRIGHGVNHLVEVWSSAVLN